MVLTALGPPNSPPLTPGLRRIISVMMATPASTQNSVTEKPKLVVENISQIELSASVSRAETPISPAGRDLEVLSVVGGPVDGCDGPGDADAEEHVDGVGARHVAHRVVSRVVLDGGHLGGERVCGDAQGRRLALGTCLCMRFVRVKQFYSRPSFYRRTLL